MRCGQMGTASGPLRIFPSCSGGMKPGTGPIGTLRGTSDVIVWIAGVPLSIWPCCMSEPGMLRERSGFRPMFCEPPDTSYPSWPESLYDHSLLWPSHRGVGGFFFGFDSACDICSEPDSVRTRYPCISVHSAQRESGTNSIAGGN